MPEVSHMLGIKVKRLEKEIRIFQKIYVIRVLENFGMINYKPRSILLLVRISLSTNNLPRSEKKITKTNISYWEILKFLMWL